MVKSTDHASKWSDVLSTSRRGQLIPPDVRTRPFIRKDVPAEEGLHYGYLTKDEYHSHLMSTELYDYPGYWDFAANGTPGDEYRKPMENDMKD